MNNYERAETNGRYVWAAILIVLAVIIATVSFIVWMVNSSANNNANTTGIAESTMPYTNTTAKGRYGATSGTSREGGYYKDNDSISPSGSETYTDNDPAYEADVVDDGRSYNFLNDNGLDENN